MVSPASTPADDNKQDPDSLKTYLSLNNELPVVDNGTGVAKPKEQLDVLLEPSTSLRLFTDEDAHVWKPLLLSGAMFLSGNALLRFSRNPRLLPRRRVLLGVASVYFPLNLHLNLAREKPLNDFLSSKPVPHFIVWHWMTSLQLGQLEECRGLAERIQEMAGKEYNSAASPEFLSDNRKLEKWFLIGTDEDHPKPKGLFHRLFDRSRFLWSSQQQRALFLLSVADDMHAAGMLNVHDWVLFAAQACQVANSRRLEYYRKMLKLPPNGISIVATLCMGFVAQNPIVLAITGALGACSLAYGLTHMALTAHTVYDLYLYRDLEGVSLWLQNKYPDKPEPEPAASPSLGP